MQKVYSAEVVAAARTQAWLLYLNAQRHDLFVGVNPVRPGAWGRAKSAIGDVMRVYLDIDEDGDRALARILSDSKAGRLPPGPFRASLGCMARTINQSFLLGNLGGDAEFWSIYEVSDYLGCGSYGSRVVPEVECTS